MIGKIILYILIGLPVVSFLIYFFSKLQAEAWKDTLKNVFKEKENGKKEEK